VRQRGGADRRIGDPVRHGRGQVGDKRVVRIDDQCTGSRQPGRGIPPQPGDEVDLAIPIELISEDVVEQQHPRLDVLQGARHGGLVDLEQTDVAKWSSLPVCRLGHGAEEAREQICARAIVDRLHTSRPQDVRQQPGRGRFTVSAGNDNAAVRQRAGHITQRVRREAGHHVAGDDCAATATETSAQPGRRAAGQQCGAESRAHTVALALWQNRRPAIPRTSTRAA